ncbi:hypothetical protein EDB84DRAFT_1434051 [Lactarius hengduanensis]|nr:hypothetical protein EDB84DRAFT_1434051 [Lactarius hengduanensis]
MWDVSGRKGESRRGVKVVGGGLCEGDDEAATVLWLAPVRDEWEKKKKKKKDKNVAPYSHLRDLREGKGEGDVACLRGVWRRAYYLLIPWWYYVEMGHWRGWAEERGGGHGRIVEGSEFAQFLGGEGRLQGHTPAGDGDKVRTSRMGVGTSREG